MDGVRFIPAVERVCERDPAEYRTRLQTQAPPTHRTGQLCPSVSQSSIRTPARTVCFRHGLPSALYMGGIVVSHPGSIALPPSSPFGR